MRISTAQMQNRGVTAMLDRQSDLSHTQQQLASGKRVLSPSDDILASTQALALQQVIETHEQYQSNANMAENRLTQEDATLGQMIELLQRARELSIQGNNNNATATGRANIAKEVRLLLESSVDLANTVDVNGDYLFAGHAVNTPPVQITENPVGSGLYDYSYTGDLGQRHLQVGATRQIAVGDPGQDVFFDVPESGGGLQNVFETLEQLAIDLESNTPNSVTPDDLLLAMDHLVSFRAKSGARLNAIDSNRLLNEDVVFQGRKTLSEVQDLDYAEAVSRMNLQLAGLEAAQQSFARIQNLSLFNFL
jgi:flagellar hook-associated protein 3 FlgL